MKKSPWIFSLLIPAIGLVGCSSNLNSIKVFHCGNNLNLTAGKVYENESPWIFNEENGKIYDYDSSKNLFIPRKKWVNVKSTRTFSPKIEGNILEVVMKETTNPPYPKNQMTVIFEIDKDLKKASFFPKGNAWQKRTFDCVELPLPKGVKVK